MFVLEVIFRDGIAFIFPLLKSILDSFDAWNKVTLLEVPLLESNDFVLSISLNGFFKQLFLLLLVKFEVFKLIFQVYDFIIWKENCFHNSSGLSVRLLDADIRPCTCRLCCCIKCRHITPVWLFALIFDTHLHCLFLAFKWKVLFRICWPAIPEINWTTSKSRFACDIVLKCLKLIDSSHVSPFCLNKILIL